MDADSTETLNSTMVCINCYKIICLDFYLGLLSHKNSNICIAYDIARFFDTVWPKEGLIFQITSIQKIFFYQYFVSKKCPTKP